MGDDNMQHDIKSMQFRRNQVERLAKEIQYAHFRRAESEKEIALLQKLSKDLSSLLEEWESLKQQGFPTEGVNLNVEGRNPVLVSVWEKEKDQGNHA